MAKKRTFESAMQELEEIVRELESGHFSLEDAIKKFEMGMKCAKFCEEKLDVAQKQITIITTDADGNVSEELFESIKNIS
ncbi:MAG: exodeoxyribonuclease VII small subunit [Desulfamplus sp.]|nr:exodeoxyribonuclease VII small subunit [Desulfamplus sp.]